MLAILSTCMPIPRSDCKQTPNSFADKTLSIPGNVVGRSRFLRWGLWKTISLVLTKLMVLQDEVANSTYSRATSSMVTWLEDSIFSLKHLPLLIKICMTQSIVIDQMCVAVSMFEKRVTFFAMWRWLNKPCGWRKPVVDDIFNWNAFVEESAHCQTVQVEESWHVIWGGGGSTKYRYRTRHGNICWCLQDDRYWCSPHWDGAVVDELVCVIEWYSGWWLAGVRCTRWCSGRRRADMCHIRWCSGQWWAGVRCTKLDVDKELSSSGKWIALQECQHFVVEYTVCLHQSAVMMMVTDGYIEHGQRLSNIVYNNHRNTHATWSIAFTAVQRDGQCTLVELGQTLLNTVMIVAVHTSTSNICHTFHCLHPAWRYNGDPLQCISLTISKTSRTVYLNIQTNARKRWQQWWHDC